MTPLCYILNSMVEFVVRASPRSSCLAACTTPTGVDHVLLHVADLDKGVRFYRILYGTESQRTPNPDRVWFQIGDTRLGLEQAPAGEKPRIAHYGVKVMPFDRGAVTAGLAKLGAAVVPSPDEPSVVRLRDPDGNMFELVAS